MLRSRIFAAAFLSLLVCACTSLPYAVPELEEPGSETVSTFDGIADVAARGDTRVLWIHGMCTHEDDWAEGRHKLLASAMGLEPVSPDRSDADPARPHPVRFARMAGGRSLTEVYLVWSPLTAAQKRTLLFDNRVAAGGKFPYERAKLNDALKSGLINDCFTDAVIYSGPNGDPIRRWVKEQVCIGLGGRMSGGGCNVPAAPAVATVLVAESLGSKLLFDAVRDLWNATPRAARSRLAAQLASVQLIFLVSNQIPLLDAAGRDYGAQAVAAESGPSADSTIGDVVRILRPDMFETFAFPESQLHIIAFTDPNDLLSYRLTPDILAAGDVRVTNVIVSNAPTLFGYLERPDHAHCGYAWNDYVLGAVVEGYDGEGPIATPLKAARQCDLAG